MQVFTLPNANSTKVLLTGDIDMVVEFAGILDKGNVAFGILPTLTELDEMELELDLIDEFLDESELAKDVYAPYEDKVIEDVRKDAGSHTHIIDISIATLLERRSTVEIASMLNPNATILASVLTNTATEFGFVANVPTQVVGIALAPSIMSTATTIDIAGGLNTTPTHVNNAKALLTSLGYEAVVVEDRLALVQMRVLATLINEAAFAVMEGVASAEDIDSAMKLGVNYPKGLLAWADEISIPVITLILDGLYREYQQERYRPCVLLKQYLRAGRHGKAVGRGFYTY